MVSNSITGCFWPKADFRFHPFSSILTSGFGKSGHSAVSLLSYSTSEIEDYEMKSTNWKDIAEDRESTDVTLPR